MRKRLRIAVCADFPEERWASMDRVATMLHEQLQRHHGGIFEVDRVCPAFKRAATRLPFAGRSRVAFNADRYVNRFWRYPAYAATLGERYDIFHIVDHSYAHLAHALPAGRIVVTCHDLDAFRSVLSPDDEPRSAAFRSKTREILTGLQRAASVTCDTTAIRDELVGRGLVPDDRLVVAPLGVDERFFASADPAADRSAERLAPMPADAIEILHVGTTAPRKRIDVLLHVCGAIGRHLPHLRLTRVGDPLTPDQQELLRAAGMADRLTAVTDVDEPTLAALYRRAALVLQPSEREGFGLPVIEALASGTPVIASDLAVLREIGGTAVEYCPVGNVDAWSSRAMALLQERVDVPERWAARRQAGRQHARRFTWQRFAGDLAEVYLAVAQRAGLRAPSEVDDQRRAHA